MSRLLLLSALFAFAVALPARSAAPPTPTLEVIGQPSLALTPEFLRGMPREQVSTPATTNHAAATFDGVTLRALLSRAGVPEGHDIRGEYLCWIVTLHAADGYKVVFALAELDPAFSDRVVLLADTRDKAALPAEEAPLRVVAPSEQRAARWIRQVTRISAGPACKHERKPESSPPSTRSS